MSNNDTPSYLRKWVSHFADQLICFLDEETSKINYLLILEYADGTLRHYLKKRVISSVNTLKWDDQLKFAKEIASVILYLHHNEIIHRDLVSFSLFDYLSEFILSILAFQKHIGIPIYN